MLMSESLAVLCELSAPQQREENRSEHHYEDQAPSQRRIHAQVNHSCCYHVVTIENSLGTNGTKDCILSSAMSAASAARVLTHLQQQQQLGCWKLFEVLAELLARCTLG